MQLPKQILSSRHWIKLGLLPILGGVDWGFFENIKAWPDLKVYSEPFNAKSFHQAKKLKHLVLKLV